MYLARGDVPFFFFFESVRFHLGLRSLSVVLTKLDDGLEWQPTPAGGQLCLLYACAATYVSDPLGAACLMSVVPLAALDQIVSSPVSPWVAWRAEACSHDVLTHQAMLPCSLDCRGTPVLALQMLS